MGLLNFFRRKPRTAARNRSPAEVRHAPRVQGNAFDPELVGRLKDDHRVLIDQVRAVDRAVREERYSEIAPMLRQFKSDLEAHLLTENYRFYTYLEEHMAGDAESSTLIREFKREMTGIARETMQFLRRWQSDGVDADSAEQFQQALARVTALLKHRIEREEMRLYPLYQTTAA